MHVTEHLRRVAAGNRLQPEQHGVDPKRRRSVAREHVLAFRELWTKEEASFDGELAFSVGPLPP